MTCVPEICLLPQTGSAHEWFDGIGDGRKHHVNGYLNNLSIKWSGSVESLQEHWELDLAKPVGFFRQQVGHLKRGKGVYHCPHALRFGGGRELARHLNSERRVSAESNPWNVLPSCTSLVWPACCPTGILGSAAITASAWTAFPAKAWKTAQNPEPAVKEYCRAL